MRPCGLRKEKLYEAHVAAEIRRKKGKETQLENVWRRMLAELETETQGYRSSFCAEVFCLFKTRLCFQDH